MLHFDISLNTILSGLIVAAIVGIAKAVYSTALVLRELRGEFSGHVKADEIVHKQVQSLDGRVNSLEERVA